MREWNDLKSFLTPTLSLTVGCMKMNISKNESLIYCYVFLLLFLYNFTDSQCSQTYKYSSKFTLAVRQCSADERGVCSEIP